MYTALKFYEPTNPDTSTLNRKLGKTSQMSHLVSQPEIECGDDRRKLGGRQAGHLSRVDFQHVREQGEVLAAEFGEL